MHPGVEISRFEQLRFKEASGISISGSLGHIMNPRKLEHGFRMINAGIPYTLP